jgi:TPR repeat protein
MGWGTAKNLDKANEYYAKAAAKGIVMATQNLARLKK